MKERIQFIGLYRTKAPAMNNSNDRVFEDCMTASYDDCCVLANAFGYNAEDSAGNVWLYVPKWVAPHTDVSKATSLLYLHSGRGELWVKNEHKLLTPGMVVRFNSAISHMWLSRTPCKMLAVDLVGRGRRKKGWKSITIPR